MTAAKSSVRVKADLSVPSEFACRWVVRVHTDDSGFCPGRLSGWFEVHELDEANGEDDHRDRGENKQRSVQNLDLVVWRTRHGGAQSNRLAGRCQGKGG